MITYLIYFILFVYIFSRVTCGWCYTKVCLSGKTALITGANSGIGYQIALALAGRGCRVVIADKDDATDSKKRIIRLTKNPNVVSKHLDLSSFASVRKFAKEILDSEARLDILINNAGIGSTALNYTEDGLQKTMQVNYFGHFLLTHLLLDLLKKSAPSRIIFTSSVGAFIGSINFKEWASPKASSLFNYCDSKLCQTVAAKCLAEKLEGTGVTAYSFHPGSVRSPIFWTAIKEEKSIAALGLGLIALLFGKSTEEGAQTALYLATEEDLEKNSGKYFSDCYKVFYPFQVYSYNDNFCQNFWEKSIKCVGLTPNECVI